MPTIPHPPAAPPANSFALLGRTASGRPRVQIGAHAVDADAVTSLAAYGREDRDDDGQLLGFCIYLIAATLVAVGVLVMGWRERFLIFTVLIGGIGFMCLHDVLLAKPVRVYCLDIGLADGRRITFIHPDEREVARLEAWLEPAAAA